MRRVLMLLVALALPASLFAQSNAVAVFANRTSFRTTSFTDPVEGVTVDVKFDSKVGYGVSYDRFFSPNLSLQLLAQRLRGDARVVGSGGGISISQDLGSLDLNQFDAALHWHFGTGNIRPYVGGGIGTIQGAKLRVPSELTGGPEETVNFDNKVTWVADAGIDWHVTPNGSIIVTAKYMPYSTGVDADPGDPIQRLKLDPMTYAVGFQWRF
ncbi:MAG TPA: OmpW family outer membrane protein [Thermoanaerobaculia bacterium]|nr:OmpW family outer membrane protein [Thermoanaerobaculia bacterium]